MSNNSYLSLLLDGPMQSWGFSSQFRFRTTGLYPTKSGVIGILAAAMGIDKYSSRAAEEISKLSELKMVSIALPRNDCLYSDSQAEPSLLIDYHTVKETKSADNKKLLNAVQTMRHYLCDRRFGILLTGDSNLLHQVAEALKNPRWGIWLGRKCCIPSTPLFVEVAQDLDTAWYALLRRAGFSSEYPLDAFKRMEDVDEFSKGTDTILDKPISFAEPRQYAPRRIVIKQNQLLK